QVRPRRDGGREEPDCRHRNAGRRRRAAVGARRRPARRPLRFLRAQEGRTMNDITNTSPARGRMGELVRYFLRLGLLGFGGPVALVGQMERELVAEKAWLSKEQMREAIAVCQSMPGPLAIQVGIYVAYLRAGFWGAWAGGWAFILPNFIIVAALGALYVYLG